MLLACSKEEADRIRERNVDEDSVIEDWKGNEIEGKDGLPEVTTTYIDEPLSDLGKKLLRSKLYD